MFGFFKKRDELNKIKEEVANSFDSVKEDFANVGNWITHIDGKSKIHEDEVSEMKGHLFELREELKDLKAALNFLNPGLSGQLSKQPSNERDKQPENVYVQTPVQTPVQTGYLEGLTVMERAIVWALINSEMKLSYEDLSSMLGKDKSTVRGQINAIKQKSEGLIREYKEPNGKKRVYIADDIREFIVKNVKVRVRSNKKKQREK